MKKNYFKGVRFLLPIGLLLLTRMPLKSQDSCAVTNTIIVQTIDESSKEAIPFANVVAYSMAGNQIAVGTTNMEGFTKLTVPLFDQYLVKGVFVGYKAVTDTIKMEKTNYKYHQLMLSEGDGIVLCGFSCFFGSSEIETEEEVWEAERLIERAEEEIEIKEDLNDFVCYPNPTSDYIRIDVNGIEATELLILNTLGQVMLKQEVSEEVYNFELNLNYFQPGLYLVVCRGSGLSSNTKTIVKQ